MTITHRHDWARSVTHLEDHLTGVSRRWTLCGHHDATGDLVFGKVATCLFCVVEWSTFAAFRQRGQDEFPEEV